MQHALYPSAATAAAVVGPDPSRRRANKFMLAGAAVVTAGALVAGPATPSLPIEIQNRAVQLTALSAKATDSPFAVYTEIVGDTVTNVANLAGAWLANPFPVLTQVATNQIGYASEFFGAVFALPANWDAYTKTERAQTFLQQWQDATAAGNTGDATRYGSSYILYGALAALSPIYNSILTYTPRGSTVENVGIPEQIVQNLANAVGAIFSPATWITGIFESVYGAAIGAVSAFSDCVVGLVTSVSNGDIGGAINSVLNMPGFVVNALLNGWQHPTAQAPFPALLTWQAGGTNATTSTGLLGQLLVKIPAAIAKAITPAPAATTTTTATVAALSVSSTETASTATESANVAEADAQSSTTESETESAAVVPASVATESVDDVTEEATDAASTDTVSTPAAESDADDADTTPAAADEASESASDDTESTDSAATDESSTGSADSATSDSSDSDSGSGSAASGSSDSGSGSAASGSSSSGSAPASGSGSGSSDSE